MNRSLVISIVMAIVATLWILSGSFKDEAGTEDPISQQTDRHSGHNSDHNSDHNADNSTDDSELFRVTVETFQAQDFMQRIDLQGEIDADRNVDVRAETDGAITRLIAHKGDRMKEGQSILKLAMNDREARLARAKADLKVARAELKSSMSLKKKNLLSDNQFQQNQAAVMAAEASVKEVELDIAHTHILSPFSGVLNELHVEQGDYVSPGVVLATVVDDQSLVISANVPQQHVAKLALGQVVEARLLDGTLLKGDITYISTSADPATRSFKIEALAKNLPQVSRFGQSARVSILVGNKQAHKVSPSLLSLDSDGGLQIKSVGVDGYVQAHAVELLRSENDGVWLTGLPDSLDLITVGQGFVSPGEKVAPVRASVKLETAGVES
jgi:multidrug efflux system membrane fusion protein